MEQTKNPARILFLQKFTEEIIINISKKYQLQRKIEAEKIRQRFLIAEKPVTEHFKKSINHKILHSPVYQKKQYTLPIQEVQIPKKNIISKIPVNYRNLPPPKAQVQIRNTNIGQANQIARQIEIPKPEPSPPPKNFNLGKLEPVLNDSFVSSIECQGAGKFLLVRKSNRVSVAKISLTEQEINEIINNFSKQAKIPLISGILKAAVGNLIISAVVSEAVGSRFIINKINSDGIFFQ